jgi:hypothetical protein
VNGHFCRWERDGSLEKMHGVLYVKCREQAEREASPTACIIDSENIKGAEKERRWAPVTADSTSEWRDVGAQVSWDDDFLASSLTP